MLRSFVAPCLDVDFAGSGLLGDQLRISFCRLDSFPKPRLGHQAIGLSEKLLHGKERTLVNATLRGVAAKGWHHLGCTLIDQPFSPIDTGINWTPDKHAADLRNFKIALPCRPSHPH